MSTRKPPAAPTKLSVAKDALKQLIARRFVVKQRNGYLRVPNSIIHKHFKWTGGVYSPVVGKPQPLQPILKHTRNCEVCALGSLLFAYVDKHNKAEITSDTVNWGLEYSKSTTEIANLEPIMKLFASDHTMIEMAFESGAYGYIRYTTPYTRLKAILTNMVANGGNFKSLLEDA